MAKVRNRKRHLQGKSETASIPFVSIGEKLRHAREARGLDVATVAEALHLKQAMVVALENEDFEKLPARVFVRGYYRNYVRFLELPEQALMKEFDELCPEGDNCSGAPPVVAQNVRKEVRSSHALVRLMTWLVVISVFAAFALWWKDYSGKKAAEVAQVAPSQDVGEEGG
ncbi:MAG TPA: helix-turn-helix domain-containing protein, partial [Chromatiaceae bacterium]|nr:helix-turn-helix domain-containing protein [Chromatiaceae bacterium]